MHGMINFPHMFSFDSVEVDVGVRSLGVVDHFIVKFLFPSDKEMANKYMHGMII